MIVFKQGTKTVETKHGTVTVHVPHDITVEQIAAPVARFVREAGSTVQAALVIDKGKEVTGDAKSA